MGKLKIPALILGTLALLAAFALLPRLVSFVLDNQRENAHSYSDMTSVHLELAAENKLSMLDKLSLLSDAEAMNITQDQMLMKEAEVYEAVQAFLTRLGDADVCQGFEPTDFSLQPKLVYDLSDPTRNLKLWMLTFLKKEEPGQTLILDVDDETGKILGMSYFGHRVTEEEKSQESNKAVIDRFAQLYFDQLGLPEVTDTGEKSPAYVAGYEYTDMKEGAAAATYSLFDSFDERVSVQITVDGGGGIWITILQ